MTVDEPAGGRRYDGSGRAEQAHRHACHPSYGVRRIIDRGPGDQGSQEERGPVGHRDRCRKKPGRGLAALAVLTLFAQPSVPDVEAHLMAQDVLLVGGGSVVNLMAVWRAHGLAPVMRGCWEAGVVLAGWSAGSLCWHRGGPTDSFGDSLAVFTDGLGLLPYSNGVHDSLGGQPRRRVYREYVASSELPAGYATEDGVGLHYIGTELHEAVAMRDGAQAWWVEPSPDGGYHDEPIPPRRL